MLRDMNKLGNQLRTSFTPLHCKKTFLVNGLSWLFLSFHIYILSHTFLRTNVYARFLLNSCLKSLKKTCQVHFFEVEARLKKLSHAFCSIFVILNAKN
jgi:hypothetical protein